MDLLFVIGPPAVDKMTVGREIADRTGLRLFHNHMMIEPVLHFFHYETPAFVRARISYVELEASMEERLRRNEGESRLAAKPSKRDLEASRRHLLEVEDRYKLNSTKEFEGRPDYLRLNTTGMSAAEAADQVITHFNLG